LSENSQSGAALIKIFTADNIVEVGLMRSLLEQHDIASELRNHHSSSLMGEVPYTSIWPELWVVESLVSQAENIITQTKSQVVSGPDWNCNSCNEANPANFDICWQCGGLR
jgi:hypothetical protein